MSVLMLIGVAILLPGMVSKGSPVMAAFDIPVTVDTVALVASSHMLSGLFAMQSQEQGST